MSLTPFLKVQSYGVTFLVALAVMAVVVFFFFRGQAEIRDANHWRSHTIEILLDLESLSGEVVDAQASARGYALTGGTAFAAEFERTRERALLQVRRLRDLVSDNPQQSQRMLDLVSLVDGFMRTNSVLLSEREAGGSEAAVAFAQRAATEDSSGRIREVISDLENEERRLLELRERRMEDGLRWVRTVFVFGVTVAGFIVAWTGWLMRGTIMALRATMAKNQENEWLQTQLARFTALVQGDKDLTSLADRVLRQLADLIRVRHGLFYTIREEDEGRYLEECGRFAVPATENKRRWELGENLVGQCAADQRTIELKPAPDFIDPLRTGLGESRLGYALLIPLVFEKEIRGVLELAWVDVPTPLELSFLTSFAEVLGVAMHSIDAQARTESLLLKSNALTEQLEEQQLDLQKANADLHSQADELRQSQDQLREQQAELEAVNVELEEKAIQLEAERIAVAGKNRELEAAKSQLSDRADQLALTSKYKSEFLANMSHELRTPLNSLMLLSRLLAENRDGNLTDKQIQFLRTIENSGNDLLTLINDILDLARIEAGRLNFTPAQVTLSSIRASIEQMFQPLAEQKKLTFRVEFGEELPETITTDPQRLLQILRNLLSNALKFTAKGSVLLTVSKEPARGEKGAQLSWAVKDTGIGIPKDKQRIIWEAFQQADGNTNRRFGGTGLGLTISRELAFRLGGEIKLESEEGLGSTFTLYLPTQYAGPVSGEEGTPKEEANHAPRKETTAPFVPIRSGQGKVLIVEDDEVERDEVRRLLVEKGATVTTVSTGVDAIGTLRGERFDCVILDLKLPDMGGLDLLDRMRGDLGLRETPVIINTGRLLSETEEARLQRFVHAVVVKGPRSISRLVDEAVLFLGASRPPPRPESRPPMPVSAEKTDFLKGRHVLIVDDDLRNIFATTSVLESHGMKVSFAENGRDALSTLDSTPGIEIVLMDIMMPEMDGYATMAAIRQKPHFTDLPIIALTAKAMATDKDKCIASGASDYLSKPVEMERLITLIQVWLSRKGRPAAR